MSMESLFAHSPDPTEDRTAFIGGAVGVTLLLAALLGAQLLTSSPEQLAEHTKRPIPTHSVR